MNNDMLNELKEKLNLNLSSDLSYSEQIKIVNKKLEELNNVTNEMENKENIIINDSELGNIMINTRNGKISGDNLKYNEKNIYNEFPVEYNVDEFEIEEIECCDLKEFENLFIEKLRYISNMKKQIMEKIVEEIWNWFTTDFTLEKLKQQFLKLEISVTVSLDNESDVTFNTSWVFVEEHSDINSGYADFYLDNNEIECSDIGFY